MNLADDYIPIPLHSNKMGLIDVHVTINGVESRFHVDTGASQSCLDRSRLVDFPLEEIEVEYEAMGLGGSQKVSRVTIDHFMVEAHSVGELDLHVIDLSHVNHAAVQLGAEPIDGVLGNDFLRQFQVVIDYRSDTMYIKPE